MSGPIVYIDTSDIVAGNLDEVKRRITDLVRFVEEAEPQLISYAFFLDDDEAVMTVVAVHPDAESLELHMKVGAEHFRGFAGLIEQRAIDVYGQPNDAVMGLLREKANMLGTGVVHIHHLQEGFDRFTRPGR